jgi:hypothetical protein
VNGCRGNSSRSVLRHNAPPVRCAFALLLRKYRRCLHLDEHVAQGAGLQAGVQVAPGLRVGRLGEAAGVEPQHLPEAPPAGAVAQVDGAPGRRRGQSTPDGAPALLLLLLLLVAVGTCRQSDGGRSKPLQNSEGPKPYTLNLLEVGWRSLKTPPELRGT